MWPARCVAHRVSDKPRKPNEHSADLQVHPVGFVELWADEKVEIVDLVVLAHQRRREAELAVRRDAVQHGAERRRRHDLHLVEHEQAPLELGHAIEQHLGLVRAPTLVREHRIRRHRDAARRQRLLVLAREARDVARIQVGPELELILPLLDRHHARAQHQRALLDRARRRNADERLAGAARQHNDAAARAPVAKHL